MTIQKTPSRRRLLAAASVGLAPVSLALWLTFPSSKAEGGDPPRQAPHEKAQVSGKVTPAPKSVGASSGS
jgi:hypothetical protein